ncbi:sulfur oxidation c-type cytochrome SoxX [Granulosicoccus sp. 3-233]|uniref:sulfur oxidation c-type cytochrome SoxX n=1 Tax=Granulosicoccus sp. 3-233 TaxID=3417969 RepID=UPI003D337ACA
MTLYKRLLSGCAIVACMTVARAEVVAPGEVSIENLRIDRPLTTQAGDPVEGRKVFADRTLGNCLACHVNSDLSEELFHGEIGPALDGVAARWQPEQLRTIVVNAKAVFTDESIMPGFYSLEVGENVREDLIGVTILTAQQVEDVVAYLGTLQ